MSDETQLQQQFTVCNERGLHARAAARFVATASKFRSEVHLICNGEKVRASSIMDLLMLACEKGKQVTIEAKGEDAELALSTLGKLVEAGLGD